MPGKKDLRVETQGIVIWAGNGTSALIVWCADSGSLVYVADRRQVGDPQEALCVGDFVDLRVETAGAMRVGRDLCYRAAGAAWIPGRLDSAARDHCGPVTSPHRGIGAGFTFGAEAEAPAGPPANRSSRRGSGAA